MKRKRTNDNYGGGVTNNADTLLAAISGANGLLDSGLTSVAASTTTGDVTVKGSIHKVSEPATTWLFLFGLLSTLIAHVSQVTKSASCRGGAMQKKLFPLMLVILLGSSPPVTHAQAAQTVTWTFQNLTWAPQNDMESPTRPPLTGSFTVDAETGALISWDITGLAHYTSPGQGEYSPAGDGAPLIYDFTVGVGPTDPTRANLQVSLPNPLPATGGTVNLYTGPFPYGAQELCDGICIATGGYTVVSGTVTTAPTIASTLPDGQAGVAYPSAQLVSGGTPPYSISAPGLPQGLIANDDGTVSGTPANDDSGPYQVTVSVTDSEGATAGPVTVSITITQVPLNITTASLPPGQAHSATAVGVQYTAQLRATGGAPPYQNWKADGLPPGLNVDSDTGAITGSIASPVPDTYTVKVNVSDNAGNSATPVKVTLATYCGNPNGKPPGDNRDALIAEYLTNLLGVPVFLNVGPPPFPGSKFPLPHCDQITEMVQNLNVGSPGCPATPQFPLIVSNDFPPALLNWQLAIGRSGLNSAYRSPDDQACAGGKKPATRSQHMLGDAADLPSIGKTTAACTQFAPVAQQDAVCKDIHNMDKRALGSGFLWTETWEPTPYPCQPGHARFQDCVHADMRGNASGFVNP
jgi:hypothetical protein